MVARLAVGALSVYKVAISPYFPKSCRFYPTCSEYAALAIAGHGVLRGGLLAMGRLLRCHPFHPGGYDPPPDREGRRAGPGESAKRGRP
jgi:putative membrane protein insertion efficiency factor